MTSERERLYLGYIKMEFYDVIFALLTIGPYKFVSTKYTLI